MRGFTGILLLALSSPLAAQSARLTAVTRTDSVIAGIGVVTYPATYDSSRAQMRICGQTKTAGVQSTLKCAQTYTPWVAKAQPPTPPPPPPPTPVIVGLTISPAAVTLAVGGTQTFAAQGWLATGPPAVAAPVTWTATGGSISPAGLYTAGTVSGSYQVTATLVGSTRSEVAAVTIAGATPPPPPPPVDTMPVPPPPPPVAGLYPHRPASYTRVLTDYAMNDAPIRVDDGPLGGGWGMYHGQGMTLVSDPTAPVSPPNVLQWNYGAGGSSGVGVGKLYFRPPATATAFYVAFSIWHDPNFEWNSISNKLFYLEPGNILVQARHNAAYLSIYIGAFDVVYDPNGYVPTTADFNGRWARIEIVVRRGTPGLIQVWLNGQLVSTYTGDVPNPGGFNEISLDSTWGGATGPRTRNSMRRIDHVLIATP